VVGTITSISGQGEPSARAISGLGCAEVVDALALVAAMDVHPELESEEARDPATGSVAPGPPELPESAVLPLATPAAPVGATDPSYNETIETSGKPTQGRLADVHSVKPEDASLRSDVTHPKRLRVLGAGQAEVILGFEPKALLGRAVGLELLNAGAPKAHE
jgi:hypothetical protein